MAQRVPGRPLATTSSREDSLPESTSLTQAQYQDHDSNGHCEATEERVQGPTSLQPQRQGQIDSGIVGDKSVLLNTTESQADPAVVLAKLESK